MYIIRLDGDIVRDHSDLEIKVFATQDDAIRAIMGLPPNSYSSDNAVEPDVFWPDIEDDKVEIYRVEEDKLVLVWGFYGWHWERKGVPCNYVGHEKSLYEEIEY